MYLPNSELESLWLQTFSFGYRIASFYMQRPDPYLDASLVPRAFIHISYGVLKIVCYLYTGQCTRKGVQFLYHTHQSFLIVLYFKK